MDYSVLNFDIWVTHNVKQCYTSFLESLQGLLGWFTFVCDYDGDREAEFYIPEAQLKLVDGTLMYGEVCF